MQYRLAVEDIEPNHWVAWVLDLPACYSSGRTEAEAVARAPVRIAEYYTWLSKHNKSLPLVNEPIEVQGIEIFHAFASSRDPEFIVNAFFENDRRPLTYWDVAVALDLLLWTRQDLTQVLQPIVPERLNQPFADGQGSIADILLHIAGAERWYLDCVGMGIAREQLPSDPLDRLDAVRASTRLQLIKLIGDERITEDYDELWSGRKVIRRALWHERDHTQHIVQLLAQSRVVQD